MKLRDVVPPRRALDGAKARMEDILGKCLRFTAWDIRPSKQERNAQYMVLQFEWDGGKGVVMTGSRCLIEDVRRYSEQKGREPFEASIVRRGKAFVFE